MVRLEMIDSSKQAEDSRSSYTQHRIRNGIRRAVKRILPQTLVQQVQQFRSYNKEERLVYLRTRLIDTVRPRRKPPGQLSGSVRSILFICFGNIMRSPMCEALMKQALARIPNVSISVMSAGLNATPGRPAHPWAIAAAHEFGISLENHRARPLTAEMVEQADLIFIMDRQNLVQLRTRYSRVASKVMLLSAYAGDDFQQAEIQDPYYQSEQGTRQCYEILSVCIRNLVSSLSMNSKE